MKWRTGAQRQQERAMALAAQGWQLKFLWWPTCIAGYWYWLTTVEVRFHIRPHHHIIWWTEYRV